MKKRHKLAGVVMVSMAILILFLLYLSSRDTGKEIQPLLKASVDFTLNDLSGNKVSLSDFKGKVVLLTFWSTRCSICEGEIPLLKEVYNLYSNKEIEILAVDIGESGYVVEQYRNREDIPYRILMDTDAFVARIYGVMGVPTDIIIDKEGNLRYYNFGWPYNLKEIINSLL